MEHKKKNRVAVLVRIHKYYYYVYNVLLKNCYVWQFSPGVIEPILIIFYSRDFNSFLDVEKVTHSHQRHCADKVELNNSQERMFSCFVYFSLISLLFHIFLHCFGFRRKSKKKTTKITLCMNFISQNNIYCFLFGFLSLALNRAEVRGHTRGNVMAVYWPYNCM